MTSAWKYWARILPTAGASFRYVISTLLVFYVLSLLPLWTV